jgi:hypothetical protein
MNELKELSYDEMLTIEGGNWFYDAGAAAHKAFCKVKEFVESAIDDFGRGMNSSGGCCS